MADFTKVLLVALGLFSLAGGVYGAVDSWPSKPSADQAYNRAIGMLDAVKLMDQGRLAEANALEAEVRAKYGSRLTPLEIEAAQILAFAWLASGLVSWALLWGLAAIISELQLLRYLVAKELEIGAAGGVTES